MISSAGAGESPEGAAAFDTNGAPSRSVVVGAGPASVIPCRRPFRPSTRHATRQARVCRRGPLPPPRTERARPRLARAGVPTAPVNDDGWVDGLDRAVPHNSAPVPTALALRSSETQQRTPRRHTVRLGALKPAAATEREQRAWTLTRRGVSTEERRRQIARVYPSWPASRPPGAAPRGRLLRDFPPIRNRHPCTPAPTLATGTGRQGQAQVRPRSGPGQAQVAL